MRDLAYWTALLDKAQKEAKKLQPAFAKGLPQLLPVGPRREQAPNWKSWIMAHQAWLKKCREIRATKARYEMLTVTKIPFYESRVKELKDTNAWDHLRRAARSQRRKAS